VVALRTVVLTGEPILTARDVESATAESARDGRDAQVLISLTGEGATRFEAATTRLVRRRMAILTNGVVRSVPVVMSKITGGRISITMGRGNPDTRYREAQDLAEALGGEGH
jgi:preprotein translocase subunit SecD